MQNHGTPADPSGGEQFALSLALSVLVLQAQKLPADSGARVALVEAMFPLRDALDAPALETLAAL